MDTSRLLRRRYRVALVLIAGVLVGTHLLLHRQLVAGERDAERINRSGMQRMLSQQVALRAERIRSASSASEAAQERARMAGHIAQMEANAAFLRAPLDEGTYDAEVVAVYTAAQGFNEAFEGFLAMARPAAAGPVADAALEALANEAGPVLIPLDRAVSAHQAAAEGRQVWFERLELALLALGLLLLALEAWLIFQPMVRLVRRTVSSLQTANDELATLAYQMSHDLRAPVASARGLLELAEDEVGDDADAKQALSMAQGCMQRLDAIISRIIALVRIRQSGAEVPRDWVYVQQLVDNSVAKVSHLRSHVRFEHSCNASTPVRVARGYLQQVLDNLVSNAVKYARDEDAVVDIDVEVQEGALRVAVSDNGKGVPEEYRDHLFGMFQRFHPEHASGSGLGLYLAQQSAKALGGELSYAPRTQGSTFELRIPTEAAA